MREAFLSLRRFGRVEEMPGRIHRSLILVSHIEDELNVRKCRVTARQDQHING